MLKLQIDISTGKVESFEAKCCEHGFESACACCMAECDNCLEA
jgi:hypothetical protein